MKGSFHHLGDRIAEEVSPDLVALRVHVRQVGHEVAVDLTVGREVRLLDGQVAQADLNGA